MRRIPLLFALALFLTLPPLTHAQTPPQNSLPDELVLRLAPGLALSPTASTDGMLGALLRDIGATAAWSLGAGSDTYRVRLRPGTDLGLAQRRLAAQPDVVYAEPNRVRTSSLAANDILFDRQASLANIHAPEAWDITTGGPLPIAILDTGVSPTHLDLKEKLLPGYDFQNRDSDPRDDDGHGTYTAGVAAAVSNNRLGVAGVCWGCQIIPVKVLNRRGQGDDATIAEGLRWAVDHGAQIISMSLGGPEDTSVLRDAVAYARDRSVLIVAASGNGQADGNLPSFPAAYESVLAVSATRADDTLTGFSTTGGFVDLAAPGAGVVSTLWSVTEGDGYGVGSGTSAACPQVAAAAALVLTIRPDLTPDQISDVLALGADDLGPPNRDPEYGFGRLNVRRAVEIATEPDLLMRSRIEGSIASPLPPDLLVTLNTGQTARPDANGFFRFNGLGPGTYTVSFSGTGIELPTQQVRLNGTALSVATLQFGSALAPAQAFAPVEPPGGPDVVYFSQTRHTLRGAFRAYWESQGGLAIFGFPISEEFTEQSDNGRERTVQYFERHRFEYAPENAPPYNVQLSRLGDLILQQQSRSWFDFPKGSDQPECRFFAETGHSLCEPFLSYWRTHGLEFDGRRGASEAESLALFGQPLSEPVIETAEDGRLLVVQWFERARFEDHGPDGVLLGLLGRDYAASRMTR
jgi:thermitase